MSRNTDNLDDLLKSLSLKLDERRKELDDREKELARRETLAQKSLGENIAATDVLQRNVGGKTDIAVSRRVLTFFENSILAASFSGRWDEYLGKDRD